MEQNWKLVGHSHQIADTGDYDGCWEITNGKVSIFSKDDDEDVLMPIIRALNDSEASFYLDDAAEFELHLEKQTTERLKKHIETLAEPLKLVMHYIHDLQQENFTDEKVGIFEDAELTKTYNLLNEALVKNTHYENLGIW